MDRKRKIQEEEEEMVNFAMEDFSQDILERVLSWLPTSAFFRLNSVCKKWKSVANSPSFKLACSKIPSRDPWFFMVNPNVNQWTIFDSAEKNWKKLNPPTHLKDSIPIASSGGLVCFRTENSDLILTNPITRFSRKIPRVDSQSLIAIAMNATHLSCNLALIYGETPKLYFKTYDSNSDQWGDEVVLKREFDQEIESTDENSVYFLSKAGTLVSPDMQKSPSKQFSSVMTVKKGEKIAYFLSSSGAVIACNLTHCTFFEYPRLLPVFCEYSVDVVECRGEMVVVLLSEFFGSSSLRVWRFDEGRRSWEQMAVMPPAMSHDFFGKRVDINCVGSGDSVFVCLNSAEIFRYVMCDLRSNEWVELPNCYGNGEAVEFMSAFSFEPRIEASVV